MPESDKVVESGAWGSVVSWISKQVRGFVDDPLGYAIEKWFYLIFFGLGIAILGSGLKWVYELTRELF